jgi:hypothetical protein
MNSGPSAMRERTARSTSRDHVAKWASGYGCDGDVPARPCALFRRPACIPLFADFVQHRRRHRIGKARVTDVAHGNASGFVEGCAASRLTGSARAVHGMSEHVAGLPPDTRSIKLRALSTCAQGSRMAAAL